MYTDEWSGYKPLTAAGRGHATVNHNAGEWARDDDGDGVREVHCNTLEGLWTGLRNFLRPFRGVNKVYLDQYVTMFEWAHNLKRVTDEFLRVLLGGRAATGEKGRPKADHQIGDMSPRCFANMGGLFERQTGPCPEAQRLDAQGQAVGFGVSRCAFADPPLISAPRRTHGPRTETATA